MTAEVAALQAEITSMKATLDQVFAQQAQGIKDEVGKVSGQLYQLHDGVRNKVNEIENRIKKMET